MKSGGGLPIVSAAVMSDTVLVWSSLTFPACEGDDECLGKSVFVVWYFIIICICNQKLTAIVECSCLKPPNISCLPWQKCICISLLFVFAIQSWLIFLTVLVGRPINISFPCTRYIMNNLVKVYSKIWICNMCMHGYSNSRICLMENCILTFGFGF